MSKHSTRAPARAPDHRVILASAGTGKTYQLTSRYLGLIAAGESCDRILATTFTRKAAGEILRKVVARLSEATISEEAARALGQEVGAPGLNVSGCVRLLESVVRSLDRLWIGTIDSFFARLAAGNALAMGSGGGGVGEGGEGESGGLGVNWRMIDEDEDAEIRSQAASRVLREGSRQDLADLVQTRNPGTAARSVHRDILYAVEQAYRAYLVSDERVWGAMAVPPPAMNAKELAETVAAFRAWNVPRVGVGRAHSGWDKAKTKALTAAEAGRWNEFVRTGLPLKLIEGDTYYHGVSIAPEARDILQRLIAHATAVLIAPLPDRTKATWKMMSRFDRAYRAIKESRGLCTFDDIPRMLIERAATASAQEMYYRLDARLHHLLLDEFQDTSVMQWRLLEPIVDEIVSQGDDRSFLCVGDVKQSLYAWRNAKHELLPAIPRRWKQVTTQEMDKSWRSSPVIIDAVNRIMDGLDRNPAFAGDRRTPGVADAVARWGEMFRAHSTNKSDFPGFVRLSVSGPETATMTAAEVGVRDAAARIKQLHEAAPHLTIGVLFRSRAHIAHMKLELLRLGVQASEEGGNPLADSPSVAAMLSMLTLADHPGNTAAHFHVAASPLGRALGVALPHVLANAADAAGRVRSKLLTDGYAGVIEDWVRRVAPSCSERDLRRLGQLVSLAAHFDQRSRWDPGTRPSAFVEFVKRRRVEDPSAAPVRLMTVHAAKGLEFHTVVLPWLDDPIAIRTPAILEDRPTDPLASPTLVMLCPSKSVAALTPDMARMYEAWKSRETFEELCVLYVALTRAIHALEIFVPPTSKSLHDKDSGSSVSFAKIVRGALHPDACDAGQELWTDGDPDWAAHVVNERPRAAPGGPGGPEGPTPPAIPAIRLDLSSASRSRRLPRRSPAAAVAAAGYGPWPGLDESASTASRARGILFHEWLAMIEWLDAGAPSPREADLVGAAVGLSLPAQPDIERLCGEFLTALQRPALRRVFSRGEYGGVPPGSPPAGVEVRREIPFAARDDENRMIVGRMDRLVIVHNASAVERAEVIDFKTDNVADPSPAGLRSYAQTYRAQMHDYQRTAARMLGCAPSKVGARLVFLSHDATIDV